MGRIWIGPVMGDDAALLGMSSTGLVMADSEGVAVMTEITNCLVPGTVRISRCALHSTTEPGCRVCEATS
jgi:hypothetical protein